jgi:hypothetical protein
VGLSMSTSDKEMDKASDELGTIHNTAYCANVMTNVLFHQSQEEEYREERSVIYSIQQIRLPTSKSSTTDQSCDNLKVEYSICSQSHHPLHSEIESPTEI